MPEEQAVLNHICRALAMHIFHTLLVTSIDKSHIKNPKINEIAKLSRQISCQSTELLEKKLDNTLPPPF